MEPLPSRDALDRNSAKDLLRRAEVFGICLVALLTSVSSLGSTHSSEVIYVWGDNSHGQLGTPTTQDAGRPEPVLLPGGARPLAVSAGGFHSLAIGSLGALFAWGDNAHGQLGDGTTTYRVRPEPITLAQGVKPTVISA